MKSLSIEWQVAAFNLIKLLAGNNSKSAFYELKSEAFKLLTLAESEYKTQS